MTSSSTTLGPAIRTLSRLARVLERGCADGDLSLPQYRLLAMVGTGGERSTALAERLAVAKPTVTAMVDSLVERGMLCRSDVAGDRRAVRITITGGGRRALRGEREDLRRWPENGWSLFGLAASLEKQDKKVEVAAVRAKRLRK